MGTQNKGFLLLANEGLGRLACQDRVQGILRLEVPIIFGVFWCNPKPVRHGATQTADNLEENNQRQARYTCSRLPTATDS